jgi:hypothetical protein
MKPVRAPHATNAVADAASRSHLRAFIGALDNTAGY